MTTGPGIRDERPRIDPWIATTWPAEWRVAHVAETGSTNTDLLAAAEMGTAGGGSVLATDHQTAGRGRLDRRWDAPPGANLLVSILFTELPEHPAHLTQRVGLAAVRAVEALAETANPGRVVPIGLKWPNDVLLDGRKLAGILAQRSMVSPAVVVGIGLNVGWAPDGAACLRADLGLDVHPASVLRALLDGLDGLDGLENDASDEYRRCLLTLGQRVRVELPGDRVLHGRAVDVHADGRLVVDDGLGRRHLLDAGDVVHLRPAPDGD